MRAWRHIVVLGVTLMLLGSLMGRIVYLHTTQAGFLKREGQLRSVRVEEMPAVRGIVYDRNGEPLAVSTPVWSLWVDPSHLVLTGEDFATLARILGVSSSSMQQRMSSARTREFLYLKRRLAPDQVASLHATKIKGLRYKREYRRYYPASETAAHIVGLAGVDDQGREGIELALDSHLRGEAGQMRVLRDRRHHTVKNLDLIKAPRMGHNVTLSIDLRLQFFAYHELLSAVTRSGAISGTVVMLDARTGEVLAMVNQPSFNPNSLQRIDFSGMRNRAIADTYEPGSTVKPLTVVAALESGLFKRESLVDTSPGYLRVGTKLIQDPLNRGVLSLAKVLQKSSQVGVAKIALELPRDSVYDVFSRVGFGAPTQLGLPGEASGVLTSQRLNIPVVRATLAYGYGLTVTPLQLAQAYLTLATGGIRLPISILKVQSAPAGIRVLDQQVVAQVTNMLEGVVHKGGTAPKARVAGYRVYGKTGTVRKVGSEGYDDTRHIALFAGVAPARKPRVVVVVIINEPKGKFGGGAIAAPVFSKVVTRALRLLNVEPDRQELWAATA